jgi:hypothetical protein
MSDFCRSSSRLTIRMLCSRTSVSETKGSYTSTPASKARARFATSVPIFPYPTIPSVLPLSSVPVNSWRSHLPCLRRLFAWGMFLSSASRRPIACSAALTLLPAGVFITTTPRRVAAARSTLSTPVPGRPITLRTGARSRSAAVTLVLLLTRRASAVARASRIRPGSSSYSSWTSKPGTARKASNPAGETRSSTTMCVIGLPRTRGNTRARRGSRRRSPASPRPPSERFRDSRSSRAFPGSRSNPGARCAGSCLSCCPGPR